MVAGRPSSMADISASVPDSVAEHAIAEQAGARLARILVIIPTGFCFGLQNLTLSFFENLPSWISCHFLITRWNDGEFPRRLRELKLPYSSAWLGMFSRKLDPLNLKMTLEGLFKLPSAYLMFLRLYRQFRPTRILLANHHEAVLLWPLLIFLRGKVVCHMHDPPPSIPFQRVSFRIWRLAIGRFVFISANAKSRLAQLGPVSDKDPVVTNGVPIRELSLPRKRNDFFCRKFGWPEDSLIVGITGQMAPTKGHEDFIAAAALVVRINPRARFIIGGKQAEPFFSTLQSLIVTENLEGVVRFGGWLETSSQFFESIDVFVLASRHDEGFGLVIAEAGERSVPTVATRSGAAAEIIVDNETGILVGKERPGELAAAVQKLLADEAVRLKMGGRARDRISKSFNVDQQREEFMKVLVNPQARLSGHG
jgi:glycosyltransferase involved in cell wall biosynthesis